MSTFDPILAFNRQLNFRTAFNYTIAQIHQFLRDVANNPPNYRERNPTNPSQPFPDPNPSDTTLRRQNLGLLRDHIIALTGPNGSSFTTPTPAQSILRSAQGLASTNPIPWSFTSNQERFFIIYDLLGAFLSIITPAPIDAHAKNFYLPLVVVYARWARTLAQDASGVIPTVAQVTWAKRDDTTLWFFYLGTSAKGWAPRPRSQSTLWRERAQTQRHGYMAPILDPDFRVWGRSPEFTLQGGRGGWNFGNCGESYPFLYLVRNRFPVNNIFGIALNVADTNLGTANFQNYWRNGPIKPPCGNCAYLIEKYGANVANFTLY